ncbi:MAG: preprotein translocase subunit SecY [Candidatus Ancaeobacter aquaticus]|nr:preprotein translocase subunit SecY [Candidatus Ancaeobacter aquaticus]
MLAAFRNIFKIPDLRKKVLFTAGLLIVVRIGAYIPTAGVDGFQLNQFFEDMASRSGATLFGMMNLFSGGALNNCTIFALGIMPYISASIVLQLLTAVIPFLERMVREGESGRRKLTQYTRYGTVVLALFQAFFIALWLENPAAFNGRIIVPDPGWAFRILTMLTLTSGTVFLMWIGEQITERGIGNGISILITVGIISRLPSAVGMTYNLMKPGVEGGGRNPLLLVLMVAMFLGVVFAVILLTQGQRKVPVQYAKRVVGRKVYGGQSTYIPLKVNYGGVIPIIFASSILLFPATIGSFINTPILRTFSMWLSPGSFLYSMCYVLLIIFFCYFWTATQFNPIQWADDMKKNGAFVPGVRPGKATADMFDSIMTRITLSGALFLAVIAILPSIISGWLKIPYLVASFFGGTGLLIIVGVLLDTMRQIESHLLTRHYDGFMKKGKMRGRY